MSGYIGRLRADTRVESVQVDGGKTIVELAEGYYLGEHGYATFGEWSVPALRRTMAQVNRTRCDCAACSPSGARGAA